MPIMHENWPVILVFLALTTQWRYHEMSGTALGIDYTAAASVIGLYGHKGKAAREVFDGVRVMESAALDEFRRQEKRRHK